MYATATTCVSQMSHNKFYNSLKLFLNLFTRLQEFIFIFILCKMYREQVHEVCAHEGNTEKITINFESSNVLV